jgi:hypothetical protein
MIVVANRLSQIAVDERIEIDADAFGRSAFNRYYYAAYLETRDMLGQLNPSWVRTPHSVIPGFLTETILNAIRRNAKRQLTLGALSKSESALLRDTANKSTAYLSDLLREAYAIRCVADYQPEQRILRDGNIIKLGDHSIQAARKWPQRASFHAKILIRIWRQLGLS